MIISTDKLPDVLAQIAARQDELDAWIEAVTESLADQSIRSEEQGKQLRVQAGCVRADFEQIFGWRLNIDLADDPCRRRGNRASADRRSALLS